MEFSHLVVNGCSFTYCQGLEDPATQGWPALLSKKIGVPVVNLAIPGCGNDAIMRTTYRYFYKNLRHHNNPLYIVVLSHSSRKEQFFRYRSGAEYYDYRGLVLDDKAMEAATRRFVQPTIELDKLYDILYAKQLDLDECERMKLTYAASILNLFKAHNVSYLLSDYIPGHHDDLDKLKNDHPAMFEYVMSDAYKLEDFNRLTMNLPRLPCGHDGLEAQEVLAEYCYNEIIKRYGDVTHIAMPYTKLIESTQSEFALKCWPHNPWLDV